MSVAHYDENAQSFFDGTAALGLGELWSAFTKLVPAGGRVLDAGCGSGRDALHFAKLGYAVDAFDASEEMVRLARAHTGLAVEVRRLQEVDVRDRYDGVWCCAAALTVPLSQFDDVLARLHAAVRPGGVCYLSFKQGHGERTEGTRTFTDQSEAELRGRLAQLGVQVVRMWGTHDIRPGREHEQGGVHEPGFDGQLAAKPARASTWSRSIRERIARRLSSCPS